MVAWCRSENSGLQGHFRYRLEMYSGSLDPYDMGTWWVPFERRYRLQIWFSDQNSVSTFQDFWRPETGTELRS